MRRAWLAAALLAAVMVYGAGREDAMRTRRYAEHDALRRAVADALELLERSLDEPEWSLRGKIMAAIHILERATRGQRGHAPGGLPGGTPGDGEPQ